VTQGEEVEAGGSPLPSITVVLPTFNNESTIGAALTGLRRQRYGGAVDVLCVDGGSTDRTRAIAPGFGAAVIENPERNEEEARALGLEQARGELILLLDADNELVGDDWLENLVLALDAADDVVSADCLFHAWRREDPAVTRLCALIGGTDPLAIDLGWADRWAYHRARWTGLKVQEQEVAGVLVVAIDPQRPPPMGSNGFLVRRGPVLKTIYRPFVHSDVVGDLAEQGWRFARVRQGVVHHYAPTLPRYARKALRRARRSVRGEPAQRRGLRVGKAALGFRILYGVTVVGPLVAAVRGNRAHRDPAWALLPLLYLITIAAYGIETIRNVVEAGSRA
jgi:glycosyltransferase involved in cell wall biosynthesis